MCNDLTYKCSGCEKELPRRDFHEFIRDGVNRPVTSKCKKCRKEDIAAKKWPDTICACCQYHRKLNSNGICNKCNTDTGLRECYICKRVLPMFLSFVYNKNNRSRTCKECKERIRQQALA